MSLSKPYFEIRQNKNKISLILEYLSILDVLKIISTNKILFEVFKDIYQDLIEFRNYLLALIKLPEHKDKNIYELYAYLTAENKFVAPQEIHSKWKKELFIDVELKNYKRKIIYLDFGSSPKKGENKNTKETYAMENDIDFEILKNLKHFSNITELILEEKENFAYSSSINEMEFLNCLMNIKEINLKINSVKLSNFFLKILPQNLSSISFDKFTFGSNKLLSDFFNRAISIEDIIFGEHTTLSDNELKALTELFIIRKVKFVYFDRCRLDIKSEEMLE